MEGYLRIGLLVITAVILTLMLFESRRRRPRKKEYSMKSESGEHVFETQPRMSPDFLVEDAFDSEHEPVLHLAPAKSSKTPLPQDLIVMSVLAKPSHPFVSYDLLQSLSSAGMQFGEMNIFHYYLPMLHGKVTLFSLASATEPGYFDMDKIGEFSCKGLTLFMNLADVPDPEHAFEIMLKTAEQLTDDLDGDLYTAQRQLWNEEVLNQYRQQVIHYVQRH